MSKPTPYTPSRIAEIRSWTKDCKTWLEARNIITAKLGLHPDNATKSHKRHGFWGVDEVSGKGPTVNVTQPAVTTTTRTDGFDADVELSKAATVEEVINLCKVDTDKWESKGFSVRRGAKGFSWSARFAAKKGFNVAQRAELFAQQADQHSPSYAGVKRVKVPAEGRLLELGIPDLHLAKLCWGQETGHADYDISIAADLYRKAVASLVESARGMGIGRILLPIGNDLLNSDNAAGETTAGTPQATSEDSRWKKAYMTACNLIVEVVEKLAVEFPVDVVVVAGNHDEERCFYLGQYIKSWFRQHPNVTVDNGPTQRKYYRFGTTLIGLTHGSEENPARLPLIMASERKDLWTVTEHHEWHLGHLHHQILKEDIGCKVRWLPSLTPPDEWHSSKGFIGNDQSAEAFVYDLAGGMIASLYFRA